MVGGFADLAIAPYALSSFQLSKRSVYSDPEGVKRSEKLCEIIGPRLFLHNVLHEEVDTDTRKGGY